ncbi:MAG: 2-amino-4-hydroxy-6-hydroxymethyldihydropteridine diphosphokinase [Synergistaceae bacterium]|nr:2-amino-4-hydroxy-6-hydroxymethyldihydropteridine diphosphokinase [Synergistaceae bacterium]
MHKKNKVLMSLGSNTGNRLIMLGKALSELERSGFCIIEKSKIWETSPWGITDQPRFLNMCICAETAMPPEEMIKTVKNIEKILGRSKSIKWGPREIDIDIIAIEGLVIKTSDLSVPHRYMHERTFVLIPLKEIAPLFRHPVTGKTLDEMISALPPEKMEWII